MKTLLLFFLIALTSAVNATNYYFSSVSGDDSRTPAQAQDPASPWKTLAKLNSIFSTLQAGDSILFKRGETFYGSITVNKSGTTARPIVISAYGTGDKPVITGMQTLSGWISVGNGIYESTNSALGSQLNMVTVNNVEQEMGRYPNSDAPNGGYLNFESHSNSASITDNELPSSTLWTGAELVVRTNRYIIDRTKITGHSGPTISYSPALSYAPLDGFGYFIQNDIRTLDRIGEWYYDPSTKKIAVYFGSRPPSAYSIKASAVNNVVYIYNFDNIVLDNLAIMGGNVNSIYMYSSDNISIKNCDVSFSGIDGISVNNTYYLKIENSAVYSSNNTGINLSNSVNGVVRNTQVKKSGMVLGMGQNTANKSVGIRETGKNNVLEYNEVDSSGYIGIRFGGDYAVVKNNVVNGFNLTKDDGGGIYTTDSVAGRKIIGNIITNGIGAAAGTNIAVAGSTSGIYLDDDAGSVEVSGNTIANCNKAGILLHNAHEITMIKNTVFNNGAQQLLMSHNLSEPNSPPIRNNVLKSNILFAKEADQGIMNISTVKNDVSLAAGNMDSNYYCRPLDDNFVIKTTSLNAAGVSVSQDCDLQGWRSVYNKDLATKKTAVQIMSHKVNALIGSNKCTNGEFNSTISGINISSTASSFSKSWISNGLDGGTLQVVITSTKPGMTTATVPIGAVSTAKKYIVGFSVKSAKDTLMYVYARQASSPYKVLSNDGVKTILIMNPVRKDYELAFTPKANEANTTIFFETPSQNNTWWLDNIRIYEADVTETNVDDSIRFEYNASQQTQTIALRGRYSDPKGNIYDNRIDLAPYTSAILIKDNSAGASQPDAPPTINITSPAASTRFTAESDITINATADDSDGTVSKVEFYNGNTLLGSDNTRPYSFTWNDVAPGNYTITAKATDNDSLVTTSAPVAVIVNPNVAPTVSITSPSSNASLIAPAFITINATAADADGSVSKVEFYNGNTLLGTSTSSPYTFIWKNVAAGTYNITAKATDNGLLEATSPAVTVTVSNPNIAPEISLTTPVANASFTAPAAITINAAATDIDGTVSKVEFYNGNTLIGTSTSSPYTLTWNNVEPGTYIISAKATDNGSLTTTSPVVTISVNPNVAPEVSIATPVANAGFIAPAAITINAVATDVDGSVSKVDFYNGATLIGTSMASPFTFTWNNVPAGSYAITAKATDNGLLETSSAAVTVSVANPNVAPSVSITTPSTNAGFIAPATITINATASDEDGSISKVEFYNGNTLLGTSTSSPYTYIWNNVAPGTYAITAKATDNGSLVTSSSAVTISVYPNVAPTVNITTPVTNASFVSPAAITINATAADVDGSVSKVEFYNGNTLLGTSTASPYRFTWNNVVPGTYTITAKATDNGSLVTTSASVAVIVNPNVAPTVSITSPSSNASFIAPAFITINATAVDADGSVSKVEFYNGNTLLGTSTSSPYTFIWKNVAAGTYNITAKATDNGLLEATSPAVTVTVSNPNIAPEISLTTPAANASFTAPAAITVNATATDVDGTVSKVEFYNGNTLIGTSTSSPYTLTWNNVEPGTYIISAKATDNGSLTTTSPVVTISVNPNIAPEVSIATPVANAGFIAPAAITINAVATDVDGSVSKVDFYNGATLIGTSTASPFTFTWNNVPAGSYAITAKATDNGLLETSSAAVTVSVANPNVAPSVSITTPSTNANFIAPAGITINAVANDEDGSISKVEFYNGNTLLGTSTSSPYTYIWNNVAPGTYAITAKATDNGSLVTSSSAVTISVNPNVAPTVNITTPVTNASFVAPAAITINATAADADGWISKVEFYNGNTLLGTAISSPYAFTWNNVAPGTYTIMAKATDNGSLVTSSSVVTVQVNPNVAPAISITSPAANTGVKTPASITINATASDVDGSISKVEFYNGNTLIGTDNTSPYSIVWKNMPAGNYIIAAVATDNKGLTATSANVPITVIQNIAPTLNVTSPALNASYTSTSTIDMSAEAADTDGTISKVEFFNGTTLLATEKLVPYTYSWKNVPAGNYTINVKATDNNGLTTSASVAVRVTENIAPVIKLEASSTYAGTSGTITMSAAASDTDGTVSKVDFFSGTTLLRTERIAPYSYPWKNVPTGTYKIIAVASDNNGLTSADSMTVYVGTSTPPTVSVSSPVVSTRFGSPSSITLNASVSDNDGKISKVEFFSGDTLIATKKAVPFTLYWRDVPDGNYTITAKATDNDGLVSTSSVMATVETPGILNKISSTSGSLDSLNIKVGPNPASSVLSIYTYGIQTNRELKIKVLSISGKALMASTTKASDRAVILNIASLPAGVYILQVVAGNEIANRQFVKR